MAATTWSSLLRTFSVICYYPSKFWGVHFEIVTTQFGKSSWSRSSLSRSSSKRVSVVKVKLSSSKSNVTVTVHLVPLFAIYIPAIAGSMPENGSSPVVKMNELADEMLRILNEIEVPESPVERDKMLTDIGEFFHRIDVLNQKWGDMIARFA
ncbi:MAG: hypothetical protein WCB18_07135 [Thermoplasmata archaeon]